MRYALDPRLQLQFGARVRGGGKKKNIKRKKKKKGRTKKYKRVCLKWSKRSAKKSGRKR